MALASEHGFANVTPPMESFLLAFAEGIGTTKQTEDVFQRGRCDERSGQLHSQVTSKRRWLAAIRSDIMTGVHSFQEIPYRDIVLNKGEAELVGKSSDLFKPRSSKRSLPALRKIVTSSSTTPWPTFTPQSFSGVCADMDLMLD